MANEGELGQSLIAFRRSAGFSQQQLAERSGIAPSTIGDIERGISRVPRPSTLLVLAQTLGLSGDEHKLLLAAGAGPSNATVDEQASHAEEFETLAAALTRLRTLARLSVPDLADRSHISLRTIRNVEKGRTASVQPLTARQLADAPGLTDPEPLRDGFPDRRTACASADG
jgi:transcriptional regulator with XRE-family HTH domain